MSTEKTLPILPAWHLGILELLPSLPENRTNHSGKFCSWLLIDCQFQLSISYMA